jgi:hypothetical protein
MPDLMLFDCAGLSAMSNSALRGHPHFATAGSRHLAMNDTGPPPSRATYSVE